ncbi:MAG: hypothetical protein HY246_12770 [Proteobacteria bacterium]|nr:hypothetical protein [Pseudomonadota bacterium]
MATPPLPIIERCAKCGVEFSCNPTGPCWCNEESFRLPLPSDPQATCLCPNCLRQAAEAPR